MHFWLSVLIVIFTLTLIVLLIFFIGKKFKKLQDEMYLYSFVIIFTGLILIFVYLHKIFLVTRTECCDSMLPNISNGYYILERNYFLNHKINYGDIVIIASQEKTEDSLIKRVIGLPGDRVQIKNGIVILNNKNLTQRRNGTFFHNKKKFEKNIEYISRDISYEILNDDYYHNQDYFAELKVPKDHYFVLGDNRDHSGDSRHYGTFHRSTINHKLIFVRPKIIARICFFVLGQYDLKLNYKKINNF